MTQGYVPFYIQKNDRAAFLACLGIGTLCAIRDGVVPPQIGIWTLGRPEVWMPLRDDSDIPAELVEVFSTADELGAVQKLRPSELQNTVDELIGRLERVLESTGEKYWLATWWPQSGEEQVERDESS